MLKKKNSLKNPWLPPKNRSRDWKHVSLKLKMKYLMVFLLPLFFSFFFIVSIFSSSFLPFRFLPSNSCAKYSWIRTKQPQNCARNQSKEIWIWHLAFKIPRAVCFSKPFSELFFFFVFLLASIASVSIDWIQKRGTARLKKNYWKVEKEQFLWKRPTWKNFGKRKRISLKELSNSQKRGGLWDQNLKRPRRIHMMSH